MIFNMESAGAHRNASMRAVKIDHLSPFITYYGP